MPIFWRTSYRLPSNIGRRHVGQPDESASSHEKKGTRSRGSRVFSRYTMGILDIVRGRETDESPADTEPDAEAADTVTEADGTDEAGGSGGRRWLLVLGGIVAAGLALYLRSRRRAAREAEFTEIELEPVESESESTSTE
jgi:hypothetical protein